MPPNGEGYESSCIVDRGDTGNRNFYLSNHFANNDLSDLPDEDIAKVLNKYEVIKERHDTCAEIFDGKDVNILSVDFWSIHGADILTYTREENIQRYNTKFGIVAGDNNGIGDGSGGGSGSNTLAPSPPITDPPTPSPTKATVEDTNVSPSPTTTTPNASPTTSLPTITSTSAPTTAGGASWTKTSAPTNAGGGASWTKTSAPTNAGGASWLDTTAETIKDLASNATGDDNGDSSSYTFIVAGSILVGASFLCILMICCRRRRAKREALERRQAQAQCRNSATSSFSSYDW